MFNKSLVRHIILFCALLMLGGEAYAKPIPDARAINAIIGEAESEGYIGMMAVASAIRNRGTLKGVYGEKAPRVKKHLYSAKTYDMAQTAWWSSAIGQDMTNGATHWENTKAFGVPYWAKSMVKTVTIGHHVFYRPKRA